MLLDGEARALTRKAIERALAGDVTALRLCLERIVPVVLHADDGRQNVARQSGWESSDNQDGHFGGRGEVMIVRPAPR